MSDESYRTIAARGSSRYEDKKSVFLGFSAPVQREEDALALIAEVKSRYPDARHHVYAYLLRDRSLTRYTDDREPQGTAGMPTLDSIRKAGLVDVAVVVVRYFGGTLLGTGGLVCAYGRAAADAISAGGIVTMRPLRELTVEVSYPDHPRIQPILERSGARILGTEYGERVSVTLSLAEQALEALISALVEATAGRALCIPGALHYGYDRIETEQFFNF
jgi:uncharacterized YigZ family protein